MPETNARIETTNAADEARGSEFMAGVERGSLKREKGRTIRPLVRLAPFVLRYRGLLAAFVVFLIAASALTLVLPAAFRLVVDCGFAGATTSALCSRYSLGDDLSGYFWIGIAVAFALGLASAARYYFISRLGERVVADLRIALFNHLMSLSPGFYANVRAGEVLSRLTTDTTLIETLVGSSISVAIRTLATTLGALALMAAVNAKLTTMVLVGGPLVLIPLVIFGKRVQKLSRSSQDRLAGASARANEALSAIETVQAFTREPEERAGFGKAAEETFGAAMRRINVRTLMTAIFFALMLSGLIAVLWFGALQVQSGAMTPGAMTQFVMYAFIAVSGAGMLTETYAEVMRASGATERIMELLAAKSDIAAPLSPVRLPARARGAIRFDDVRFAYPLRPETQALTGVTLDIRAGETVALVGPSGAGKSTMFQLILRFYDPQSGAIRLDGTNIRDLDPADLRRSISVVQQNAPLFSGDAAANIRYGRPDASDDEVRAAAKAANADDFISALPQAYATPLGANATALSGGQRQRIAIARAILRNAPVLLLDEATSSLDSESERAIQDAFERISVGRTTIVIAHRLSTVLRAHRIVVMDDGRIVDQGTHRELIARGGLYARLAELQFNAEARAAE